MMRTMALTFGRLIPVGLGLSLLMAACGPAPAPAAPTSAPQPAAATVANPAATAPAAAPAATPAPAKPAPTSGQAAAAPGGKTVTWASGVDIETMDPMVGTSSVTQSIMHAVFDGLVVRANDMQPQPSLATSWDTPDDSTWVFHLRSGVKFSNGEPVDAAAVKFSVERFQDPTTKAAQASLMKPIKSVDVIDPQTVRFTTDGPYAGLLDALASYFFVMSPSIKGQDANKVVIGSGPYQFVSWQPGERLVIKANPDYWGQKPKLDQIVLRPISEAATRLVELQSGGVDLVSPVPTLQYSQIEAAGATLAKAAGANITIMFNADMPPFGDVKVRQAFNYAVDKQAIVSGVLQGAGYPAASPLRQGMLGYDASLQPYPYDPNKAKDLLSQAGATNLKVELGSSDGRYPNDKLVAQAVAAQLGQIGVQATVTTGDYGAYVQNIIAHKLQFFLIGQVTPVTEINLPQAFLPSGALYQNYKNEQVQAMIQKASQTIDRTQREALYKQIAQSLHDDVPWLYLYAQQDAYGLADKVTGFVPRADGNIWLNDLGVQG
jgi:peptide/nickel transport system substrate-binding protein